MSGKEKIYHIILSKKYIGGGGLGQSKSFGGNISTYIVQLSPKLLAGSFEGFLDNVQKKAIFILRYLPISIFCRFQENCITASKGIQIYCTNWYTVQCDCAQTLICPNIKLSKKFNPSLSHFCNTICPK